MLKILFPLLLILLGSIRLAGQSDSASAPGDRALRMSIGVGGGAIGLGAGAALQFESAGHMVVLDGSYVQGLDIFASRKPESLGTIGLLYGHAWRRTSTLYIVSAGVAYMAGRNHVENSSPASHPGLPGERSTDYDFSTVGVPLRGGIIFLTSSIGVGAGLYANLNMERSAAGVMLLISFGDP